MIEVKSNITQQVLEALSQKTKSKIGFIPDEEIVSAIRTLEEKGIPNNKHEDYKYCNIESYLRREFKTIEQTFEKITPADVAPYKLDEAINIVVLNGTYDYDLSEKIIVPGITVKTLAELSTEEAAYISTQAKSSQDALIALNSTYSGKGLYLEIKRSNVIPMPIHIIYINTNSGTALVNPRNFIHAKVNTEATIVESFVHTGKAKVFSNYVSEKLLEQNAKLNCLTIQNEGGLSYSVNTNQVKVNKHANYSNATFTLSGELVRNNHNVELADAECEAHLNGLFVTNHTQLVDNHTLIDHQMPNCQSNELYKGIAKDKSTGVFNGKIFVRKDAQKTNAYQSSKNILLSDDATINTKPQLEIYADDVKCSHGTSTGKVDEEALFYLKARGIGDSSARKLLLQAFAQELIDKIEIESLQKRVLNLFEKAL